MTDAGATIAGIYASLAGIGGHAAELSRLRAEEPARACLVLEDEEASAWALTRILRVDFPGLPVDVFGTVAAARAHLLASPAPRLAILDLQLPDERGWTLAELLPRGTRVVLISGAYAPAELAIVQGATSATSWMAKPLDFPALLRIAHEALDQ